MKFADDRMMDQPVDGSQRHGCVREDPVPFAEGLVCSDQDAPALVSDGDQFEQHTGFGLILGDGSDHRG